MGEYSLSSKKVDEGKRYVTEMSNTNDNPHYVMAGIREGAMSILIGIAESKS